MSYLSPLRYPGGKASIAPSLADIILFNNLEGCKYYEPYAGGAGVALHLLMNGLVKSIHLNDADYRIYAFWYSIIHKTQDFLEKLKNIEPNMDEWHLQKSILENPSMYSDLEVGFATFFHNRCNRSGILSKAGPIGGKEQQGKWKIGARFNKSALSERILKIASYKKLIYLSNQDAIEFLKNQLPKGKDRRNSFIYLDPPYFVNGKELYLNFYKDKDHKDLSAYMKKQSSVYWVMTYDNADEIKELYEDVCIYDFKLKYSLQNKTKAKEIMIIPKNIKIPKSINVFDNNIQLKKSTGS